MGRGFDHLNRSEMTAPIPEGGQWKPKPGQAQRLSDHRPDHGQLPSCSAADELSALRKAKSFTCRKALGSKNGTVTQSENSFPHAQPI